VAQAQVLQWAGFNGFLKSVHGSDLLIDAPMSAQYLPVSSIFKVVKRAEDWGGGEPGIEEII